MILSPFSEATNRFEILEYAGILYGLEHVWLADQQVSIGDVLNWRHCWYRPIATISCYLLGQFRDFKQFIVEMRVSLFKFEDLVSQLGEAGLEFLAALCGDLLTVTLNLFTLFGLIVFGFLLASDLRHGLSSWITNYKSPRRKYSFLKKMELRWLMRFFLLKPYMLSCLMKDSVLPCLK